MVRSDTNLGRGRKLRSRGFRGVLAFAVGLILSALAGSGAANAADTEVFTAPELGGSIPCQTDGSTGIVRCEGPGDAVSKTVRSFDETPIDVNFSMPDKDEFGAPPYPTVMFFHGYGGSKEGFGGYLKWLNELGYAAFSMTERGFGRSCGERDPLSELDTGGEDCSKGFIHLMDTRYEVRDAQYLIGHLVDEGIVDSNRIGSVGASYGGGKSMALATLRDRVMLGGLPGEQNGTYAEWTSPEGTPISLKAAAPIVPWTDIAYALMPNGRTLEYLVDQPYLGPESAPRQNPIGVMKIGILRGLYGSGDNYSGDSVGSDLLDERFDVPGWKDEMELGETYSLRSRASFVLDQMTRFHSSYYIDDSVQPAPLLIAQGPSDDLFPLPEALRFYNRTKVTHPNADISLLFADIGHPRAPLGKPYEQGRTEDKDLGFERVRSWFDHFILGEGVEPVQGVEVKTQVCPYSQPSGGPFRATDWASMAPGEVRLTDTKARTIGRKSNGLNISPDDRNHAFETALNFGVVKEGCSMAPVTAAPGTVEYSFPKVPGSGYTLMGAPTVEANISVSNGPDSQIAGRLFEVYPNGLHRLVARGVYRPDASGRQVFQLNGNTYSVPAGNRLKLQLVAGDFGGFGAELGSSFRASNDQKDVRISNVDIRLPVMEKPGAAGGQVKAPLPKTVPAGYALSPDYRPAKLKATKATLSGRTARLTVSCPEGAYSCGNSTITLVGKVKGRSTKLGGLSGVLVAPGRSATVGIGLTGAARKALEGARAPKNIRLTVTTRAGGVGSGSSSVNGKRTGRIG